MSSVEEKRVEFSVDVQALCLNSTGQAGQHDQRVYQAAVTYLIAWHFLLAPEFSGTIRMAFVKTPSTLTYIDLSVEVKGELAPLFLKHGWVRVETRFVPLPRTGQSKFSRSCWIRQMYDNPGLPDEVWGVCQMLGRRAFVSIEPLNITLPRVYSYAFQCTSDLSRGGVRMSCAANLLIHTPPFEIPRSRTRHDAEENVFWYEGSDLLALSKRYQESIRQTST